MVKVIVFFIVMLVVMVVRGDDEGRGLLKQDRLEDKDADERREMI